MGDFLNYIYIVFRNADIFLFTCKVKLKNTLYLQFTIILWRSSLFKIKQGGLSFNPRGLLEKNSYTKRGQFDPPPPPQGF